MDNSRQTGPKKRGISRLFQKMRHFMHKLEGRPSSQTVTPYHGSHQDTTRDNDSAPDATPDAPTEATPDATTEATTKAHDTTHDPLMTHSKAVPGGSAQPVEVDQDEFEDAQEGNAVTNWSYTYNTPAASVDAASVGAAGVVVEPSVVPAKESAMEPANVETLEEEEVEDVPTTSMARMNPGMPTPEEVQARAMARQHRVSRRRLTGSD